MKALLFLLPVASAFQVGLRQRTAAAAAAVSLAPLPASAAHSLVQGHELVKSQFGSTNYGDVNPEMYYTLVPGVLALAATVGLIGFALDTALNWDAEEGCILVPEDAGEKEVCGRLSADTEGCVLTGNGWVCA